MQENFQSEDQFQSQSQNFLPSDYEPEKSRVVPGAYKPIPEQEVFSWIAPSRPFKKRDRQFFSTVLIIGLLVSLILFFAGQLLPIAVVISVIFLVYVLAVIPPGDVNHRITTYGIHIDKQLYYWEQMGRFWFEKSNGKDVLKVEVAQFPGRLVMVVDDSNKPIIKEILSEVLLQQKPELTVYEKVAEWLQKKVPLDTLD